MLKKITICSICGSQSCDGKEWEIVPGDQGLKDYLCLPGARNNNFQICSSLISKDPEPTLTIVAGHGISFVTCVRKKKLIRRKK